MLVGFWSVDDKQRLSGITSAEWEEDAKKALSYLHQIFGDLTIAQHWADDFNGNNGLAEDFDRQWPTTDPHTLPAGSPDYSSPALQMNSAPTDMFDELELMSKQ